MQKSDYDDHNDDTFGNDETFENSTESSTWEEIQQNSSQLAQNFEKLKIEEKKPFNLMSFGKPSPSKGFSSHIFNMAIDDEEEEEEELMIPQKSKRLTQPHILDQTPQKPEREDTNQSQIPITNSPMNRHKFGVGSSVSGTMYPQGSTTSSSEDGFKKSKRMLGSEVEFIVRQQLLGLEMSDPYVEDFYYCALVSKKGF